MDFPLKSFIVLLLVFMLLTLDLSVGSIQPPQEKTHNGSHNSSNNTSHLQHHHGVQLLSWRWNEYSNIISFTSMLIMAAILKILFHHAPTLASTLPESCVLIIIGIIAGGIIYTWLEDGVHHLPKFTNNLFFNVLLPPIILDSAYSLYDREFLGNLGSVLFFALVGTIFNIFVIGSSLYGLMVAGLMDAGMTELNFLQCMIFSSLISAVDPVAVLAIFEEIGVNMGLYFLVFGESLLNDGVTVVIYNTVIALAEQEIIETTQYILAFFSFFTVVFGGLLVGIIIGALSAFVLKFTTHCRVIEPLIMVAMGYLSFILAETFHWSGILSLIGCGICQKRYAFPNVSKKTYTTVKYGVKTLSAISDCIIFLFLGTVTISSTLDFEPYFILWTIALCLVVRFVGVFFLSWIINHRRIKPITLKEQFIMAYGGLRGAVGFSLAQIIPSHNQFHNVFLTTTLVVIFFTVFVQGGTIKFLVNKLKIKRKAAKDKSVGSMVNGKTIDHVMVGVESITGRISRYTLLDIIRNFDEHYIKIWLIKKGTVHNIEKKLQEITLEEHYARLYGPTVLVSNKENSSAAVTGPQGIWSDDATDNNDGKISSAASNVSTSNKTKIGGFNERDWNKKDLRKVFSTNPYERYHNKLRRNSEDEQLEEQLNRRWRNASLIGRRLAHNRTSIQEEGGGDSVRLKWQGAASKGLTTALIKKQYSDAKEKFKQLPKNENSTLSQDEEEKEIKPLTDNNS